MAQRPKTKQQKGAANSNEVRSEWHEFALSLLARQLLADPPLRKKELYDWVARCVNETGTVSGRLVTPRAVEKAARDKKRLLTEMVADAREVLRSQAKDKDDPPNPELVAIGDRKRGAGGRRENAGRPDAHGLGLIESIWIAAFYEEQLRAAGDAKVQARFKEKELPKKNAGHIERKKRQLQSDLSKLQLVLLKLQGESGPLKVTPDVAAAFRNVALVREEIALIRSKNFGKRKRLYQIKRKRSWGASKPATEATIAMAQRKYGVTLSARKVRRLVESYRALRRADPDF